MAVSRRIKLEGTDVEFELKVVSKVNVEKNFIHFDQLPDGNWRLVYSGDLIPDISKVLSFVIVRDNGEE